MSAPEPEPESSRLRAGWQELLDATRDAMPIVDDKGIIVAKNRARGRLFGWPAGELIGTPMARCVPARFQRVLELWPDESASDADATTDRWPTPVTLLARRHDGTEFPVEISRAVIGAQVEGLTLISVRDLTAWRRAQESLLREKRADDARLDRGRSDDHRPCRAASRTSTRSRSD
ncbi:MAG: PAS domain S-box protein [Gemmatimonadetes bacterium]|nr:PAS domain S-box protein [Gemmatimonadota bacterium]